jgi:putative nucleic acid binding protein
MNRSYFLFSLVGLVFAGFIFSRMRPKAPPQTAAQVAAPEVSPDGTVSVGAVRLFRDYQENEVAADNRYKGKRMKVTGTMANVERDIYGAPVLHLWSGNPVFLTMATLDRAYLSDAAQLKKGDKIVVRCIGNGVNMRMPQLEKCMLLEPEL